MSWRGLMQVIFPSRCDRPVQGSCPSGGVTSARSFGRTPMRKDSQYRHFESSAMAISLAPLRALQRLQRDLKDLCREPLPGVHVHVDPSDLTLMCLILTLEGLHSGLPLHLSVSIPPSYPRHPPKVSIETPISGHPNIFNSYICCDILRPRLWTETSHYMGGYTPAYLLKYIFLQLLTFFSAHRIEQEDGHFRSHYGYGSIYDPYSKGFSCHKCGFDSAAVLKEVTGRELFVPSFEKEMGTKALHCTPPLPARLPPPLHRRRRRPRGNKPANEYLSKYEGLPSLEEAAEGSVNVQSPLSQTDSSQANLDCLHMLNDHVWFIIFNHLSDQDLVSLGRALPTVAKDVLCRYNVLLMRELVCFFTRKTFREALLGVGVRLQVEALSLKSYTTKKVLHIEAFDMLSFEVYEREHVRQGIWGHTFTHFLPLGLDDDHFMRAVPTLQAFLTNVGLTSDLSPTGFLDIIPKLMNTMIVNMMKECAVVESLDGILTEAVPTEAVPTEAVPTEALPTRAILQASEKSFKGYCLLFHLLMKLSTRFPLIKAKAQEKLTLFLSSKKTRNKKSIPDLGEFVAVLPLVLEEGYDWATLSSALVEELLTRNVMWVLKEKPELALLGKMRNKQFIIPARRRLKETFMASQTGLRLMMLQANFMRALVKWRSKLNATYGFPPGEMAAHLVELVKRIYVVQVGKRDPYSAWKDFFTILNYEPIPSVPETVEMLKTAVLESKSRGYHCDDECLGQMIKTLAV